MQRIQAAEIVGSPFEVIRPDAAVRLGQLLTPVALEHFGYIFWLASQESTGAKHIKPGLCEETQTYLTSVEAVLAHSLSQSGLTFDHNQQLVSGLNQRRIGWHVDSPGDVRFLLNIGEEATYVDVATEWDPSKYLSGDITYNPPAAFERLEILPGQAYVANNMVASTLAMRPHETPLDSHRLVLRTTFNAVDAGDSEAYRRAVECGVVLQHPEYCQPQAPLVVTTPTA